MRPVIVVSSHIAGLGVIRALGSKGVPVIAASYRENDMGHVSKYVLEVIRLPHPEHSEEEFIDLLYGCCENHPGSLLIPTDDESLIAVSRNRDYLARKSVVSCAGWNIVQRAIEKKLTYKIAEENEIPIPRTLYPESPRDIQNAEAALGYPCVLKPVQSHRYFCAFGKKLSLVNDHEELMLEYDRAIQQGIEVVIQEYIPGHESCNANYCTYFWNREPLTEFTAEKVRQTPAYFGVPCVLVSKMIPEILPLGRKILRCLHLDGYACVEFKKDARDGVYKLMDVNARANLSILHSFKCGINFPWIIYQHLIDGELPPQSNFIEGIYWIDIMKDVMQNAQVHKRERRNMVRAISPYLSPKIFAIFDRRDIRPFIKRCYDITNRLLKTPNLPRVLERTRRSPEAEGQRQLRSKRIYIEGDACNRRLLEKTKIERYLECNDYSIVKGPGRADYILAVTCAFKKKEEEESIARLRELMKYDAKLLVYGCLPEISKARYREFHHIQYLTPKELERIDTFFDDIRIKYADIPDMNEIRYYRNMSLGRLLRTKLGSSDIFTRAFLARVFQSSKKHISGLVGKRTKDFYLFVCKGCLGKCSYCAIRRAIGSVKSKPLEVVLGEFRQGIRDGYRNIHILGDDPGCYGIDNNSSFTILLTALLDEWKKISSETTQGTGSENGLRLNIKEIHPKHLISYKHELYNLLRASEIKSILCPVQSGNNRILELMGREHTAENVCDVLSRIRRVNPRIELSTQIIIGFPSETDSDFLDTMALLKRVRFHSVVVFPYHDKEDTVASILAPKTPDYVIDDRMHFALQFLRQCATKTYFKCPL